MERVKSLISKSSNTQLLSDGQWQRLSSHLTPVEPTLWEHPPVEPVELLTIASGNAIAQVKLKRCLLT